jgi:hypothetical protein
MPEHFPVLIWPSPRANPSPLRQSLKERTAQFILKTLGTNTAFPWCARMLARLKLPPPPALSFGGYRGPCRQLKVGQTTE